MSVVRGFVHRMYRMGPRTDPCATPKLSMAGLESPLLIIIHATHAYGIHGSKFVCVLKIPYPFVSKSIFLAIIVNQEASRPVVYRNTRTLHTGKKKKKKEKRKEKKLGNVVLWLLLSPGIAARAFRALHWDKRVM